MIPAGDTVATARGLPLPTDPHCPPLCLPGKAPSRKKMTFLLPEPKHAIPAIPAQTYPFLCTPHTHRTSAQLAHGRRQGVNAPLCDPVLCSCASRCSLPRRREDPDSKTSFSESLRAPRPAPRAKTVRARKHHARLHAAREHYTRVVHTSVRYTS